MPPIPYPPLEHYNYDAIEEKGCTCILCTSLQDAEENVNFEKCMGRYHPYYKECTCRSCKAYENYLALWNKYNIYGELSYNVKDCKSGEPFLRWLFDLMRDESYKPDKWWANIGERPTEMWIDRWHNYLPKHLLTVSGLW